LKIAVSSLYHPKETSMAHPRALGSLVLAAILSLSSLPARAAKPASTAAIFPEIKQTERELKSVPGYENAPAVVLFKKGRFSVLDPEGRYNPNFVVQVRRKILTEEGKKYGEASLFHSKLVKLERLEGRTVLPDGREIPLPKGATFKRTISKTEKLFITSIAFPAVEVGAILDYQYEIRIPSIYLLEPWYFQEEVPTLDSEMIYLVPEALRVRTGLQDPLQTGVQQKTEQNFSGWRVMAWGKNLPPIPNEPNGFPFADLASRFLVIPVEVVEPGGRTTELLKTWESTCAPFAKPYEKAQRKSGAAGRKARELATPGNNGERARAVYRFVRDEIETVENPGVGLPEDSTADSVLAARRGDYAEKALLLQTMLKALGIPARLVWVGERDGGQINLAFTTPWWFERVIVAAEIDGQRVFLDPSDRRLAFGRLAPGLEGMQALLYDPEKPEPLTLPVTPFEENLRRAALDLDLDAGGRLSGRGTLRLAGHHAWHYLRWKENAGEAAKAWKEWLASEITGFEITDVKVTEAVEETRIEVTWAMAQREEEVLGDEASFEPSRPLGPVKQRFVSPAESRISPVLFAFADRDEVEVTLRWPEGWSVETLPASKQAITAAGTFEVSVETDEAARRAVYRRRMDIKERQFARQHYPAVQSLYGQVEKSDAQPLVLLKR
jgi:transglutaminase-like putative cysteine protease